jgi:hypothetical protein
VALQREEVFELVDHPFDDVGVGVEGDGHAGVAQEFLDVFRVLTRHEEYRSVGVPNIMSADLWRSGAVRRDQAGAPRIGSELRRTQRLSMLWLLHGVDG